MPGAARSDLVRFWRDPALPGVEARSSFYTRNAFRIHTHAAWTIAAIERGTTHFPLGDQPPRAAGSGDLVIIPAQTPHACNPDPGCAFAYRLVALSPDWLRAAMPTARPPRFFSPVLRDEELFDAWRELHAAFVENTPAGTKRSLLAACLARLVERHAEAPDPTTPLPRNVHCPAVTRALRLLEATPGRFLSLDELALAAGLSRCRFAHVFRAEMGLPPHVYQMQQSVERAKSQLAAGTPISRVAAESGFADQSHFSRRFREFTGATPGQYASR